MSNHRVVVFTKNNARILKVSGLELFAYKNMANAVIDPDMSRVKKLPPHLWKLVDGKVLPLNFIERPLRNKNILKKGADNEIVLVPDMSDKYIGIKIVLASVRVWCTIQSLVNKLFK